MLKRDLILRIIEELNRVVAKVLALRQKGELAAAQAEVDAAAGSLAGMDLTLAAGLGPAALARQVAEPVKLAAVARLMLLRALLAEDRGDETGATTWESRGVELCLEAAAAGATLDQAEREAVDAWPEEALSARGRALKGQLPKA
jgi:hypothetical protein